MDCSLPGSNVHGDSPGKNTWVGCHAFFQGICPIQGSNPGLLHCRQILYHLSHQGRKGRKQLHLCLESRAYHQWLLLFLVFKDKTLTLTGFHVSVEYMCVCVGGGQFDLWYYFTLPIKNETTKIMWTTFPPSISYVGTMTLNVSDTLTGPCLQKIYMTSASLSQKQNSFSVIL